MDNNFKDLRRNLNCIKNKTQLIDGHTVPNDIKDCWDEVEEIINYLESVYNQCNG